jgi:hypothetical protein
LASIGVWEEPPTHCEHRWPIRNSTIPQVSVAMQQQVNTWHTCLLLVLLCNNIPIATHTRNSTDPSLLWGCCCIATTLAD